MLRNIESHAIHIVDHDMVKVNQMALRPAERERFHTYRFPVQPYPIEYEYIQYGEYDDSILDEITIDHYSPYYKIERDGVLLAEVFQRNHNYELKANEIIKSINTNQNNNSASLMTDNNFTTSWENNGNSAEITMELNREYVFHSIEIFPVTKDYQTFPKFELYASSDGKSWQPINYTHSGGGNSLSFQSVNCSWLKIQTESSLPGIYDMLFYGN